MPTWMQVGSEVGQDKLYISQCPLAAWAAVDWPAAESSLQQSDAPQPAAVSESYTIPHFLD